MIEPIPAIIFAAKSSEDVRNSIGTQIEDCRDAIEREGGREIVGQFSDEARSAFKGNRGDGLAAAKRTATTAAEAHGAAELWVQHSDRLARGDGLVADHLAEIYFAMRRVGVRLRSVQDDGNLEDVIRVALIGERNHEDSKRKSAAVRSGKARRAAQGRSTGPLHDGYALRPARDATGALIVERDGRVIYVREIDPQRGTVILRAFAMVESGATYGEVARTFNREGLRTLRGKTWTTRRVRETIGDPFYAGWTVSHGECVEGIHEPLIERERWLRIQAGLRRLDPATVQRRKGGRATIET